MVVRRIDEGLGLLLEVPSEPAPTPGFVHISNAGEAKIDKLQQVPELLTVFKLKLLHIYVW